MGSTVHVGTRSVLFTDLVGSTELRFRIGEEEADELRRTHDELLGAVITTHAGTVVKGLGDGIMATFDAAGDAVAAAVAAQQAVDVYARRSPARAFSIRVGVSTGDVSTEDGDVFGAPVVEASRLCAAAAGGEVLVAELVRALTRGRGGFVFEPMGELELKGLPDPVPTCRVGWEPLHPSGAADQGQVPIAPALLGTTSVAYVGRTALRDRLRDEWAAAQAGACRTVLLAGEPGVGKTRTAGELARTVFADGALVLFGRCDEDLGVPYQPFVEALEQYVQHAAAPALGRLPGELRRLVPDLGPATPRDLQPLRSDPASEEHRLFEACASWLVAAAAANGTGLLLVLDDLHWATKPTLQLMRHVIRHASQEKAPLLVVATYRDTDIDRTHPLAASIGDLRRLSGVERVTVDNLSIDECESLIEAAAGHELDDTVRHLSSVVYGETEGNPFFVGEVLRHLVETGGVRRDGDRWVVGDPDRVTIPEGVRDVVGRRLDRLSAEANELLSVASAVGRDFDVAAVVAVAEVAERAALDALDEAVRARLVEETGIEQYRFAHALVRTTLYEEMSATRRRRLHRRIADVIETLRPEDVRALAYHCTEAGPDGGDVSRAVRYTLAAAEESLAARAFGDAEARFRAALDLLEDDVDAPETDRVAALCGLGEAQRDQGDAGFRLTLLDASHRAIRLGAIPLLMRAVVGNTRGLATIIGDVDPEVIGVIEQALDLVGPEPGAHRAQLLSQLADELTFSGEHERRLALAEESVAMARSLGDDRLLAAVLVVTTYAYISSDRWRWLAEHYAETASLADAGGDPGQRAIARAFLSAALLAAGRVEESGQVLREMVTIAEAGGSPFIRWIAGTNSMRLPLMSGDLDEAQRVNDVGLAAATELLQADGEQWWAAAYAGILWLRGQSGLLASAAADFADALPRAQIWRGAQLWMLTEAGRLDEARAVLAAHDLDPVRLNQEPWFFSGSFQLAVAAFHLDDADLARRVIPTFAENEDAWAHYFMFVLGPLTWPLGLAEAATGDHDGAITHLDAARSAVAAQGMLAHLPMVQVHLATVLLRRNADGDAARAGGLLADARAGAVAIEATGLLERIDELSVGAG